MRSHRLKKELMNYGFVFVVGLLFGVAAPVLNAREDGENKSTVSIAQGPLYGGASRVHPNVLLSLSVEYPTTGIAYTEPDYDRTKEYIGYFDSRACYSYIGSKKEGYFSPAGAADSYHECEKNIGRFSGNFMNWVSSSAIDMLRYAMTGGDRVVDTTEATVLQRAYLRGSFYASSNFPMRKIVGRGNSSRPAAVTPFDRSSIVVVSCKNYVYFGTDQQSGNNCDAPVANGDLGQYLARVEVCSPNEGPRRPDLCKRYGKHFKPVGEMQKNADRIRFGAFGYLMDDTRARYGGVLRAPMKYLGESTYDARFASAPNPQREWDPATGIFISDPENAKGTGSGLINYLNKFGRSGTVPGTYKSFDPVSELFYEAIRYYRHLGPTPAATAGMTERMQDGSQVLTSWNDPILASCQKNYIISIADANTHCDKSIPGNTRGGPPCNEATGGQSGDAVNYADWTNKVGEFENRSNLASVMTGSTDAAYYMAGIAYWANTQDIRPDLGGKQTIRTFSIDVDEYGNGDIDAAKQRQLYYAGKYGGFKDLNGDANPFRTASPEPGKPDVESGLEWERQRGSGVPNAYFMAGQPLKMVKSIQSIFEQITEASGTTSSPGVSSSKVYQGGAITFRPGFNSARWSGSLASYQVSLDSKGALKIGAAPEWDAGIRLTDESIMTDAKRKGRRIYTSRPDEKNDALEAIRFEWKSLGPELQAMLDKDPATQQSDDLGSDRLDYLHGVRAKESRNAGGVFRNRDSVLGDLINSGPVYVGKPGEGISDADYQAFFDKYKTRKAAVYVGANDGMLHAFSAETGNELFAYIPHAVFPHLAKLTDPGYVHRPYVDATPTVAEANVDGDPETFDESNVLWEFTDKNDPDIGNVVGEPRIAKFRVGDDKYKWFVVATSGMNNNQGDGFRNAKAPGVLFLLSLDKKAADPWVKGQNYRKFVVPASDSSKPNGLSSPTVVTGNSQEAVDVYAGDLQGNLWKFNFRAKTPFRNVVRRNPEPLFRAEDAHGNPQPITVRPRVAYAPGGGYMVLFGTGKFIEHSDADPSLFTAQSFYAVHDDEKPSSVINRSSLAERTLTSNADDTLSISGSDYVLGRGDDRKRGWYADFYKSDKTGERSVSTPLIAYNQVFFNSLITSEDPCGLGGGRGYALDLLTGLPREAGESVGHLSEVGMLSSPVLFATSNVAGGFSATGARGIRQRHAVISNGTKGMKESRTVDRTAKDGQLSWREVVDFQRLQQKAKGEK
jgi:type IV pilus assembly protein PilY1